MRFTRAKRNANITRGSRFWTALLAFFILCSIITIGLPTAAAQGDNTQPTQSAVTDESPQPSDTPLPSDTTPQPTDTTQATDTPQVTDTTQATDNPPSPQQTDSDKEQIIQIDGKQCIDGEVIVKFKSSVSLTSAENAVEEFDGKVKEKISGRSLLLTEVPEGESVKEFISDLKTAPGIEYAQPNYIYTLDQTVNDPYASANQWYLNTIGAYRAWDITMGDPGVRVAVIDTGIDTGHPEFAGKIYSQINIIDNNDNVQDYNGHGTHVAGIIAADANNNSGICGIAPGVQLIIVDVFGTNNYASTSDIATGISYAVNQGAKVINLSLGCYQNDTALQKAIESAAAGNVIIVAAAGNNSTAAMHYPSDYSSCISVIATTSSDVIASYSNFGPQKDIAAPGSGIFSTYLNDGYTTMSGTSSASPMVAAAAALVLSANPDLSASQATDILYNTAADLGEAGRDDYYGCGRLDAYAAVLAASGKEPVPQYAITTSVNNLEYGTVSGGGLYDSGSSVTLDASPKSGYQFVDWIRDGIVVSTDTNYSFAVSSDITLTAEFAESPEICASACAAAYNKITISWNAVNGASGYCIYRSASEDGIYKSIKSTKSTIYNNTGLNTGTTYYYKVYAYYTVKGKKVYGNMSEAVSATPVMASVTDAAASAYDPTSIKIAWNTVPGRSGYEIWRSESPDSGYELIKTTSAGNFKNTGLLPNDTYYYMVRAYRTVNRVRIYGDFSEPVSAMTIFNSVTNVNAAVASPTSVKITWNTVAGRKGYEIWRSTSADDTCFTYIGSTTRAYYTDKTIVSNITYYYKVRAYVIVCGERVYSGFSDAFSVV